MTTSPIAVSSKKEQSQGLVCPNCAGVVPVAEGLRVVQCPYCSLHSLVQGDRGIRRWHVARRLERDAAEASVQRFYSGMRKARDLRRAASVTELFLAYLPFWRVEATVAGWLFGRVRKDKDSTKPDEHMIFETLHWNDAAIDVSEFGVHRITVNRADLLPFDSQALHAEAMVFEPTESRTEAFDEAKEHFLYVSRNKANQEQTYYENVQLLRPDFGMVYYPVWIARYAYRNRTYPVIVDAVSGQVMYGKAPGNTLYRAAALVVGLAIGNLILVNGTILAVTWLSSDDDGLGALVLPIIAGLALIVMGYRHFRYGEEVEDKPKQFQKAATGARRFNLFEGAPSVSNLSDLMRTGMTMLEDFQETAQKGRPPR